VARDKRQTSDYSSTNGFAAGPTGPTAAVNYPPRQTVKDILNPARSALISGVPLRFFFSKGGWFRIKAGPHRNKHMAIFCHVACQKMLHVVAGCVNR
jgi:hypothetical protein